MAETVPDQLDVLVDALGSDRQAAAFVGLSHTQFGAWRGGAPPSPRSLTRIADGVSVIDRLRTHGLTRDQIRSGLLSLWPELGERPAVLVAAGATKPVLDAINDRYGDRPVAQPTALPADLIAALRALSAAAASTADALAKATP